MEISISGEVYNLNLDKIKSLFNNNLNVSVKHKSTEEIYVENDFYFLDIYDNSDYMKNTFLIGGILNGEFNDAVALVNKMSELFFKENVAFELNANKEDKNYLIKHQLENI